MLLGAIFFGFYGMAIGGVIGGFAGTRLILHDISERKKSIERRTKYLEDKKLASQNYEKERQRRKEEFKTAYALAYSRFFPKWREWQAYLVNEKSYNDWFNSTAPEWALYKPRAAEAVKVFDAVFSSFDKREGLRLGLYQPQQRLDLFRAAFPEIAKHYPDFGILIPSPMDQHRCAQSRNPIDMIFHG